MLKIVRELAVDNPCIGQATHLPVLEKSHHGLLIHVPRHDRPRLQPLLVQESLQLLPAERSIGSDRHRVMVPHMPCPRPLLMKQQVFGEFLQALCPVPGVVSPCGYELLQPLDLMNTKGSLDLSRPDVVPGVDEKKPGVYVAVPFSEPVPVPQVPDPAECPQRPGQDKGMVATIEQRCYTNATSG